MNLYQPDELVAVNATVNGEQRAANTSSRTSLADFLRHDLRLTGTHVGCEQGSCGSCTVIVDGDAVRSCLMLAVQAKDSVITTVEGLSNGQGLGPLQEAFWSEHGLQCGFCTPGILCTVHAADHDQTEISELIDGHICRCTGYENIRRAVETYFETMSKKASEA